tara:strand:- start:319 stop:1560 length:1242 start_codon:yes stop_codon:yes gene_type:complete
MKIVNLIISLPILILVTILVRITAFYVFGDHQLENEWLIIVNNLFERGVLGINVVINEYYAIPKLADENDIVLPSVFMPPLYSYYIFFFKYFFSDFVNYVNLIIFTQILLSTVSVYFFFKILSFENSHKISCFFSYIFSLIPINIYSCVQISSISSQIFLLVYLFYILKSITINNYKNNKIISFTIVCSLLILLRGEFILFYIFTLIYFFIFNKKSLKLIFISLILSSLVISPYLIRNYINFDSFVITKSFGYNLLKGNNPEFKVEGNYEYIEKEYDRKNLNIKTDLNYEINLDNFYKKKAINYIFNEPFQFFLNYIKKVFAFLFLDLNSSYNNYYNFFHIIPKLLLSISSILGISILLKKKGFGQYISCYFILSILFFSIFFILPRYNLILLPIQVLVTVDLFKYILRKFFN